MAVTTKSNANEKAKKRLDERKELGTLRPVKLPKMPAWKINALNQVGEDTLNQVLNKLDTQNRVMVVRPTGFGKSYMLAGLTSAKNKDGSDRFKSCLYIYPTKVIKSDMLDTYGVTGGDNRANKLKNTTFITYHMLGELVRIAGLQCEQLEDDESNEIVSDKSLKISKLGFENNVYDTSAITWYNNLIKSKNANVKKEISELNDKIKDLKAKLKESETELNKLIEAKSKAKVKMQKLKNDIALLKVEISEDNDKINKLKKLTNDIKSDEDSVKTISIASADDLFNWLKSFDLILIDEAHRTGMSSFTALWDNILSDLVCNGTTKMVGATATPYRLDGVDLEESIFGNGSKLKSIDINDCIKPNNYEYLGINLDVIMEDPAVLDEGTTREYLESRGLFKEIDYVYAIHNKEEFIKNIIEYINRNRQYGNSLTEENKDKLLKAVGRQDLIDRRANCKLTGSERELYSGADADTAKEIKKILNRDMSAQDKEYAISLLGRLKNENIKDLFRRKLEYKLTTEELDEVLDIAKRMMENNTLEYNSRMLISRRENYLKKSEIQYIINKVDEIPSVPELLKNSVGDRNTYGLNYMKFIAFFASSDDLNEYISRDRQSQTLIGRWFKSAFPGYHICESSLHTGKGTKGVEKIKPESLGEFKPTDKVIDIIYCVDQLNMGYHVENITGVILFRNTESASVYNQQIGRCCSVRAENNTIMIDIIDKKDIADIMKSSQTDFDFGLDEEGKQKDLRYLLDDECINVCDLSSGIIKTIDNMKDMHFTDAETIKFLYVERHASADIIKHMTNIDIQIIQDVIEKVELERKQLRKIKSLGVK